MRKHWITKPLRLFSGAPQVDAFRQLPASFPVRVLRRSDAPNAYVSGEALALPASHTFAGQQLDTPAFLAETETVGLIVLHEGVCRYEWYAPGIDATLQWPTWSVVKSFISALVGLAVHEGTITSIDDHVTKYVPALAGSAYDGASIRAVLQMSSGARWDEDYSNPDSDLRRRSAAMAGGSYDDVARSCVREYEPGTHFRYNTSDTHVLGMVLRRATRQSLTELLRDKLWQPLGMQDDAFWRVDGEGIEDAGAGLHATLRDMCKLGLLYSNDGRWNSHQLVPEAWVQESTRTNGPHVAAGALLGSEFGYGYQWWLTAEEREFAAIGIYNQYVYVDARRRVVIGKVSANRNWGRSYDEAGYRDAQHMALFRAIAAACAQRRANDSNRARRPRLR